MIELLIIVIYVVISLAFITLIWSITKKIASIHKTSGMTHNIPARKIRFIVIIFILSIMAATYFLYDIHPIQIGNTIYNEEIYIRIANMFVTASISAIGIASSTIIITFILKRIRK